MKKLLLFTTLLLGIHFTGNSQSITNVCYYTDASGFVYLRAVLRQYPTSPGTSYSAGIVGGSLNSPYTTPEPDPDGINYDFIFQVDADVNRPFQSWNPVLTGLGSGYYITDGYTTYWSGNLASCIPTPITSCISQDVSIPANASVKLVFDKTVAAIDPVIYLWGPTTWSTNYVPVVTLDADGINFDYTFSVPKSALPSYSPDQCYSFSYFNSITPPTGSYSSSTAATTVCPCCTGAEDKVVYSINTAAPLNVHLVNNTATPWDFGDMSADAIGPVVDLNHTYPSSGSYLITTNNIICNKSNYICVPTVSQSTTYYPSGSISPDPCTGVSFTAEFDNDGVVNVSTDVPFTQPATSVEFSWNDGSAPSSYSGGTYPYPQLSHTYTTAYPYSTTPPTPPGITISMNYTYRNNAVLYFPVQYVTCLVDMNAACIELKHAPNSVAQTKQTIDEVKIAPNPASDLSFLTFTLLNEEDVKIIITDAMGRAVSHVLAQKMSAGDHRVELSTNELASGLYNVTIQTNDGLKTERLSVVK